MNRSRLWTTYMVELTAFLEATGQAATPIVSTTCSRCQVVKTSCPRGAKATQWSLCPECVEATAKLEDLRRAARAGLQQPPKDLEGLTLADFLERVRRGEAVVFKPQRRLPGVP